MDPSASPDAGAMAAMTSCWTRNLKFDLNVRLPGVDHQERSSHLSLVNFPLEELSPGSFEGTLWNPLQILWVFS